MNNKDRKELRKIAEKFNDAISASLLELQEEIQCYTDNEQDKIDNLPENLQYGERADRMQEYIEALEQVCSDIDDMIGYLDDLVESINNIADDNI